MTPGWDNPPKTEYSVIIYSPSNRSKPVWLTGTFFCWTRRYLQKFIFLVFFFFCPNNKSQWGPVLNPIHFHYMSKSCFSNIFYYVPPNRSYRLETTWGLIGLHFRSPNMVIHRPGITQPNILNNINLFIPVVK